MFIDERANDAQCRAIETIASGVEAAEGYSFLQVFASTMECVHPTLYVPIESACNEEAITVMVEAASPMTPFPVGAIPCERYDFRVNPQAIDFPSVLGQNLRH